MIPNIAPNSDHYELTWKVKGGLTLHNTCNYLNQMLINTTYRPQFIVFHVGTNDLMEQANEAIYSSIKQVIELCGIMLHTRHYHYLVSYFPTPLCQGGCQPESIKKKRAQITRSALNLVWRVGGKFNEFPYLDGNDSSFFRHDIHLSSMGYHY